MTDNDDGSATISRRTRYCALQCSYKIGDRTSETGGAEVFSKINEMHHALVLRPIIITMIIQ
jgi:hypothetical protein